ncbi:MAG: hypothetical protein GC182_08450 [Rhodopseudomonas sp.]|nr:hypothetical protein [Rhodopseudomonas sp.]
MGVKAQLVRDADEGPAGGYELYKSGDRYPAGMIYQCPCGCKRIGALAFRPHASPSWEWDGNQEQPTLSPSVHDISNGKTHWHGYLRNGVWENC